MNPFVTKPDLYFFLERNFRKIICHIVSAGSKQLSRQRRDSRSGFLELGFYSVTDTFFRKNIPSLLR